MKDVEYSCYVIVDRSQGDSHVDDRTWIVRKDAAEACKSLNFMHQTTRYAVKKLA